MVDALNTALRNFGCVPHMNPMTDTEMYSLASRGVVRLPPARPAATRPPRKRFPPGISKRKRWRIKGARYRKAHRASYRKYQRDYMRRRRANAKRLLGADLYEI